MESLSVYLSYLEVAKFFACVEARCRYLLRCLFMLCIIVYSLLPSMLREVGLNLNLQTLNIVEFT